MLPLHGGLLRLLRAAKRPGTHASPALVLLRGQASRLVRLVRGGGHELLARPVSRPGGAGEGLALGLAVAVQCERVSAVAAPGAPVPPYVPVLQPGFPRRLSRDGHDAPVEAVAIYFVMLTGVSFYRR